jgi:hypothetical protein
MPQDGMTTKSIMMSAKPSKSFGEQGGGECTDSGGSR